MRDVYAASFDLGRPDGHDNDVVPVAAATTLGWVTGRYGLPTPDDREAGDVTADRDRATWRTDRTADDSRRLWQLDWRQHSTDGAGIVWMIRCQIGTRDERSTFTVRIAVESTEQRLSPVRYEVGRPGVIARLANAPGIHLDQRPLRRVAHVGRQ